MSINPCVEYLENELTMVTGMNANSSIKVIPIRQDPYVMLRQGFTPQPYDTYFVKKYKRMKSIKPFELCGPLVMMAFELAQRVNFSLKINAQPSSDFEFMNQILSEAPDIILIPIVSSQFDGYNQYSEELNFSMVLSDVIDFTESSTVISRPRVGYIKPLDYFNCFDAIVWLIIAFFFITLSLMTSMVSEENIKIFKYLWNFSILLFRQSFQKYSTKFNCHQNYFFGIWIMTSLAISITFTSYLLDFIKKPVPLILINTFEDIADIEGMKFYVIEDNSLEDFANNDDSDLAKAIKPKMIKYKLEDTSKQEFRKRVRRGLTAGTHGLVMNKLTLILYVLTNLEEDLIKESEEQLDNKLIESLYISKDCGGDLPLFMPINSALPSSIKRHLNDIVVTSRESGLYGFWIQDILRESGYKQDINENHKQFSNEYSILDSKHFSDLFYLFLFSLLTALLVFSIEKIVINFDIRTRPFTVLFDCR